MAFNKLIKKYYKYNTFGNKLYRQLDYFSTSGCLIDVGYACKSTLITQAKFSGIAGGGLILGADSGGSGESDCFRMFAYSSNWYLDFGSGNGYNRIYGGTFTANTVYNIEYGNRYIKNLDTGSNIISSSSVSSFTKSYNTGVGVDLRTLYYLKIYDGTTLVRDLVPCYRISDNVVGLYDKVNNVFYTASSGTLTKGTETIIEGTSSDYDYYEEYTAPYTLMKTTRKYYKYVSVDVPWTRPNLSANGTIGGSSFAIAVNSENSSSEAGWTAFDSSLTSNWVVGTNGLAGFVVMYNPTPIKITEFTMTNGSPASRHYSGGTIYGSNDNSTYTTLTTFSNSVSSAYGTWTISLSSNTNYYKYYAISLTYGGASGNKGRIADIKPTTAYTQGTTTEEGTSTDYDFYVDTVTPYTLVKGSYITY